MRRFLRKAALRMARFGALGAAIAFLLKHVSGFLPIKKVYEDNALIGFWHPVPVYAFHMLLVPKARVRTVFDVPDAVFATAVRASAGAIRDEGLYQLRINGGARQEVMQAHFHLYPAKPVTLEPHARACVKGYDISVSHGRLRIADVHGFHGFGIILRELDSIYKFSKHGFSVVIYIGSSGAPEGGVYIEYS